MNESDEDVLIVSDEDGIDKPGPDCDVVPDAPKKVDHSTFCGCLVVKNMHLTGLQETQGVPSIRMSSRSQEAFTAS